MEAQRPTEARAFAPCHVTGIVLPDTSARDPRARGSKGAGLVLRLGVRATARLSPALRRSLSFEGAPAPDLSISREVARRLVAGTRGHLVVRLEHDLPIGQGFGTSAAGALATALAVAPLVGKGTREAVEVAHLADLFGGGGLGGVAAILGGGLEVRRRAGLPPFGQIVRRAHPGPLLVGTLGPPLRSPDLLADRAFLRRLGRASGLFEPLLRDADPTTFWDVAEAFTSRAGLCPRPLATLLRSLRRRGARAAQAMFGGGYFAWTPGGSRGEELARWLAARGIHGVGTSVASGGARRMPARGPPVGRAPGRPPKRARGSGRRPGPSAGSGP